MSGNAIMVGKIFGIKIAVDYSWFIVLVLIIYSFGFGALPYYAPGFSTPIYLLLGILGAVLFFFSILFHELNHTIVARHYGIPVDSITFFVFGGVSNITREPRSAKEEFFIAIAGPLSSFFSAGVFLLLYLLITHFSLDNPFRPLFYLLTVINISLGIFNLLPGFPLDGGRVFRSLVWAISKDFLFSTRIAIVLGQIIALGIIGIGIYEILLTSFLSGIWLVFIGIFLYGASSASYNQAKIFTVLNKISIAQIKKYCIDRVDIKEKAMVYLARKTYLSCRFALLLRDGQPIAVTDLEKIPKNQISENTKLADFSTPIEKIKQVSLSAQASKILEVMKPEDPPMILVMNEKNEPIGVLTLLEINNLLLSGKKKR